MNAAGKQRASTRERRHRWYFRLMDLCLLAAAIGTADWLRDDVIGWKPWSDTNPVYLAVGTMALFFSFLVGPILILVRPLRDEYAEQLWKRTAEVMIYFVTLAPLAILAAAWANYLDLAPAAMDSALRPFDTRQPFFDFMWYAWMSLMLLFVGIFQFLRWKDSR
ncbi:hypothetical protein GRI62_05930 [Erythrobacter arachoides]|uniref:Uncharacterized protein n=1 Tax=Aurantiacibacter arachoides TaxID=1850444 RepID=A0A844ZZ24_9SPHN|nr:hypothetical protein [Aurantiacibacter arachoides]MXO93145.1 hypothetical protein [Aurantiacibacter arachoides]GGD51693.1 hypothetical protein GCM10011411_09400 [Aurantiacibacter arachoides]